jgi:hypothetical protein
MRNSLRLPVIFALALFSTATAAAQSAITAQIYDNYRGYACNLVTGQQPYLGLSGGCYDTPISGGTGYANSNASRYSLGVQATTSLSQSLGGGSQSAYAIADAQVWSSILVNGTSAAGQNLVFHFDTYRAFGFLGTSGGSMQSYYQLSLNGAQSGAQAQGSDTFLSSTYSSSNAVQTANGLDFTVDFDSFTGSYAYDFYSYVYTYHGNDQYSGAFGSSVLNAHITGIDEVDSQGNLLASAVIAQDGSATLQAIAPEPATLTLFGSGFTVFAGATLFRRRRA